MPEIPTKPGWWVWSETPDLPREIVRVFCLSRSGPFEFRTSISPYARDVSQGHWHHEVSLDKPASPWRPASEPPKVRGNYVAEVLTRVDWHGSGTVPRMQLYSEADGWEWPGTVVWMPIPPHGEGGAE